MDDAHRRKTDHNSSAQGTWVPVYFVILCYLSLVGLNLHKVVQT